MKWPSALSGVGKERRDGVVEGAVLELEARAGDPDLRVGLHQLDQALQGTGGDPGVRVEDERVGRVAARQRRVVGAAEAGVGRVDGQLDLRELAAHHLGRAVAGGVVDDVHGERPGRRVGEQRARGSRAAASSQR